MALERKDRVRDTTTTTGTGTVSLSASAPTGFRSFVSAITSLATVRYLIESADLTEWELGEGIFTDATPDTLTRVTVFASSNAGSLVSFSTGTKTVSCIFSVIDIASLYQLAEGKMLNGKIVPSVASNDLTVALKTQAGADPSKSDPVYIMLGGTLRVVTAATSYTLNDATNWFNSGSAELGTREIDYFVYLWYNTTDAVVRIGWGRKPYWRTINTELSFTSTSASYFATNTTNYSLTDYMSVIGRFAATLSLTGTGHLWTVPTFDGDSLVQGPIYQTRKLSWAPNIAVPSGTVPTYTATFANYYQVDGNKLYFDQNWDNTSGGTAGAGTNRINYNLPFANSNYVGDRSSIGVAYAEESAGTSSILRTFQDTGLGASNVSFTTSAGASWVGNDQSSTSRRFTFIGFYFI